MKHKKSLSSSLYSVSPESISTHTLRIERAFYIVLRNLNASYANAYDENRVSWRCVTLLFNRCYANWCYCGRLLQQLSRAWHLVFAKVDGAAKDSVGGKYLKDVLLSGFCYASGPRYAPSTACDDAAHVGWGVGFSRHAPITRCGRSFLLCGALACFLSYRQSFKV